VKAFIIKLSNMKWLRIAGLTAALVSGLDDLIEAWFGIHDLFGLDVAHGLVATALTGVLDPLAKLFEQGDRQYEVIAKKD